MLGAIRRQHQVDVKNVRAAIEFLKERFGSEHPLIEHEMNADGKHLFAKKYGSLINASRRARRRVASDCRRTTMGCADQG